MQLLRSYLETMHPIELSLWSGGDILGQTHIPLHKIVKPLQQKAAGDNKTFDVLTEEFLLPLNAPNKTDSPDEDTARPTVKIQVKLVREAASMDDGHHLNSDRQQRARSSSANHNSTTTIGEHDPRYASAR